MPEQELQKEIAALRARVEQLERERWTGPPRLGPKSETSETVAVRTKQIIEAAVAKHEHEQDADGRQICTTSGEAPSTTRAKQTNATGQHESYIVLCEEERAKGFVRPYRDAYRHVGRLERDHPASDAGLDEVYQRVGGCGTVTTMGRSLSETYARDPNFYGATFCCGCNRHLPVSEFVWTADGQQVGS
jgi:hypothetical protein